MDLKKFKHDLQKEKLIIPSMSDKVKNYSKQEIVYKEKKEKVRISFAPLLRYSYLLIPILIMLLTVTICSLPFGHNNYKYELYSVKNKQDLEEIINFNNSFQMDGLDFGFGYDGGINAMPEKGDAADKGPAGSQGPQGPQGSQDDSNPDYSQTNKQEQGVDEADIVKTDGYSIYYINTAANTLSKYDVKTEKLIQLQFENLIEPEMYVTDKYVVLLQGGVSCNCAREISVNVYNKETLEIVTNYIGEGIYIDSRLTNNVLYLIYTQTNINEQPYDIIDFEENIYDYSDIKYSPAIINKSITYIVSMDLDTLETDVHLQLGAYTWQAVYMTENRLYLASSTYCSSFRNYTLIGTRFTTSIYQTNILVFDLNKTNIKYKGTVITSGLIKNQFYLDEYDNHLRIVLQQQNTESTGNNKLEIYSLSQYIEDGVFKKVASIDDGIGKTGEQIKSVRFSDTSCLIVTFFQTDPLYYIDLTDQLKPEIIAGYEEPGYNTYLHYINDNLAIGFGVTEGDYVLKDDILYLSYHKVGLYSIENGIPNKVDENNLYYNIQVVNDHKALYIEGEVFGFSGYILNKGSNRYWVYDVYTVDYEGDMPKLKLIKRFSNENSYFEFIDYYQRMIRIEENYYLITKDSIEILDSNFEVQKSIIIYDPIKEFMK